MRSIHTTKQQDYKNNTPHRVIHKHRTKLGNPIWGIILPITSIITLSSTFFVGISATYAEGNGGSVSLSVDNSDTVLELTVPESVELNLTPSSTNNYNPSGTASLSVSAGTNNITGYTLTMSVPNTNLTNSGITLTSDNNPNNIPLDSSNHPIIPAITSTYSDSNFPDNAWGYRLSTSTNYSPVPSSIELASTNSAGNATTTTLELIAKVNATQPAGTYTTAFNFLMVAKPIPFIITWDPNGGSVSPTTTTVISGEQIGTLPTPTYTGYDFLGWFTQATGGEQISEATTVTADATYWAQWEKVKLYMQDFTLEMCQSQASSSNLVVYDKRDEKDYAVRYINGQCWMTQNLRFTGTSVPAATSNVATNKTLTYYQLDTNGKSGGKCYDSTGYSNACIKDSGSTTTGVWYNYYAATAGTISGSSNSTAATQDICPSGWHLPSGPNTRSGTDFNKLVGNTTSGLQNPTTGLTAFGAVAGGLYSNGSLLSPELGVWWSATAFNDMTRYSLVYNSSNGQFNGYGVSFRYSGYFVRCVRSS